MKSHYEVQATVWNPETGVDVGWTTMKVEEGKPYQYDTLEEADEAAARGYPRLVTSLEVLFPGLGYKCSMRVVRVEG